MAAIPWIIYGISLSASPFIKLDQKRSFKQYYLAEDMELFVNIISVKMWVSLERVIHFSQTGIEIHTDKCSTVSLSIMARTYCLNLRNPKSWLWQKSQTLGQRREKDY